MIIRDGFAVVAPGESSGGPAAAGGGAIRVTIDAGSGCRNLVQHLLEIGPHGIDRAAIAGSEEVCYVAAGSGRLLAAADVITLEPGTGFLVPPGIPYRLEPNGSLSIVSVVCPPPGEPGRIASDGPGRCVAVREADQEPLPAGESRTFKLLVDPAVGCRGVTQFLGFIEQSRAPEHVHTYEEVIHILGGAGTLHAAGDRIPIERGSSVFLAPGTPHCLENGTRETLRLLGVFSPAGSPAARRED